MGRPQLISKGNIIGRYVVINEFRVNLENLAKQRLHDHR